MCKSQQRFWKVYIYHLHKRLAFPEEIVFYNSLRVYADYIHKTGAPVDNCWRFVDGIVQLNCPRGIGQRQVYNDHKKFHSVNFRSVVAPSSSNANTVRE